jgi:hypothetical protein
MRPRRDDIRCAVISSGAASFRAYLRAHGLDKAAGAPDALDPISRVGAIRPDPARRILVIGDPRDENVYFWTQQRYFEALEKQNLAAELLPLQKGEPPEFHSLVDLAETATGLCANNTATPTIVDTLHAMPAQQERVSN